MLGVAGNLRRALAKFENPGLGHEFQYQKADLE